MKGTLTPFHATYANILTSYRSTMPYDTTSAQYECSPTACPVETGQTLNFGTSFSPGTFSAQKNLTSELLRYL